MNIHEKGLRMALPVAPSSSFSSLFCGTWIVVLAVSTLGVVLADVMEMDELLLEDPVSPGRKIVNIH